MKKTTENQMCCSCSRFIRDHLVQVVAILALMIIVILTCWSFNSSLFSSILLSFVLLIVSTVLLLFTFNERKLVFEVNGLNEVKDEMMEEVVDELQPEHEDVTKKEPQQVEEIYHEYLAQSEDLFESESIDLSSTSEDSDIEWPYQIPTCSDDSISDDDSLIEIALPECHYINSPKADYKSISYPSPCNLPEFLPESIFGQEGIMELLAEMNEEDNLIEIDISMGSIKCPRFEIEA